MENIKLSPDINNSDSVGDVEKVVEEKQMGDKEKADVISSLKKGNKVSLATKSFPDYQRWGYFEDATEGSIAVYLEGGRYLSNIKIEGIFYTRRV